MTFPRSQANVRWRQDSHRGVSHLSLWPLPVIAWKYNRIQHCLVLSTFLNVHLLLIKIPEQPGCVCCISTVQRY